VGAIQVADLVVHREDLMEVQDRLEEEVILEALPEQVDHLVVEVNLEEH
jgi:hypothetical protein